MKLSIAIILIYMGIFGGLLFAHVFYGIMPLALPWVVPVLTVGSVFAFCATLYLFRETVFPRPRLCRL